MQSDERITLQCLSCGYDRSGLAADWVCPECGAPPVPAASDPSSPADHATIAGVATSLALFRALPVAIAGAVLCAVGAVACDAWSPLQSNRIITPRQLQQQFVIRDSVTIALAECALLLVTLWPAAWVAVASAAALGASRTVRKRAPVLALTGVASIVAWLSAAVVLAGVVSNGRETSSFIGLAGATAILWIALPILGGASLEDLGRRIRVDSAPNRARALRRGMEGAAAGAIVLGVVWLFVAETPHLSEILACAAAFVALYAISATMLHARPLHRAACALHRQTLGRRHWSDPGLVRGPIRELRRVRRVGGGQAFGRRAVRTAAVGGHDDS